MCLVGAYQGLNPTDSLLPSCLSVGQDHKLGGTVGNPFADREFLGMNVSYVTESIVNPVELPGAQKYRCRSSKRGCLSRVPAEGTEHSWSWESWLTQSLHCCSYNKHFTDKILDWACPSVLKCNLRFAGQEVTSRSVNQEFMKMLRISRDNHPHVQGQKPFSGHF